MQDSTQRRPLAALGALAFFVALLIVAAMIILPAYGRYQARQNEANIIAINELKIQQTAQTAKAYLLQAQQYSQQIQEYMAFVHDPSLGAAMGIMNQAGLSNDLPVNPLAVQSLTSGVNGLSGVMSGPLVRSSYRAGRLYKQAIQARGHSWLRPDPHDR